jgi:lactate permease
VTWSQNYTPLVDSIGLSALVAAVPVVTLLALLAFWHVRAHLAALVGLLAAAGIAIIVYGMPAKLTLASAGYGAAFGLFPIGWIVLNAIFIYNLSVETGGFKVLQDRMSGLSNDRRIQALMIAFSFGAFIEGFAGFGAPVAITGALMIGLGFRPLEAAKLALIGNTAPVAFGSVGIPIITLAKVTGLDESALSMMVGRQLPFFSLLVPFWLVAAQAGWRGMIGVWPACFVTGVSFALVQFLMSNYHGPYLVDAAAGLSAIGALITLMRFWKPREIQTHPPSTPSIPFRRGSAGVPSAAEGPSPSTRSGGVPGLRAQASRAQSRDLLGTPAPVSRTRENWRAWLPWILLTVFVAGVSFTPVKNALNKTFAPKWSVPALHQAVQKMPPVVAKPEPEAAQFTFNLLSATGTALFVAGVLAGLFLGIKPRGLAWLYGRTIWRVRVSLLTIALMLALGFTTRYSGTDTTMGLAFASTGFLFPFFSPLLGWLGVALTGSDTSSNVLFGNLQKVTAEQIGVSPILTAAANSAGGVMGKMIDAQSIVVASVATGGRPDSPDAGSILRVVFWHSLALATLVGVLVMLQAYVFKWMVVVPPAVTP